MISLVEQSRLLRTGAVSAVELAEEALVAARDAQVRLHAFADLDADAVRVAARDADRRRAAGQDGPLLGVPVAVKDDADVLGRVTGWGSAAFTRPAATDGPTTTALRRAGVVPLGRTALPELAAYGFTESAHLGVTRNPLDPARTPGGSSGGSAAVVAAGVVAAATASDGAGSIRIPAACCGLPGIKPTTGTMPGGDLWNGLATHGCLTRSVADAALYLQTLGSFPDALDAGADPPPLRVGVTTEPFPMAPPGPIDAATAGAVRVVADGLADAGHHVAPVRLPGATTAALAATARFLRSLHESAATADDPERLEARTREIAWIGGLVPARLMGPARRQGRAWGARVLAELGVDVLLTPTMRGPAPEVGRWAGRGGLATLLSMGRFYAHTPAWNHTGQPAATLPVDVGAGLPRAAQLVAGHGRDALLVALAAQVEAINRDTVRP